MKRLIACLAVMLGASFAVGDPALLAARDAHRQPLKPLVIDPRVAALEYAAAVAPLFDAWTKPDSHPAGRPSWRQVNTCISNHESVNAGYYRAYNPSSGAGGAYQMLPSTSRVVAGWIGRPDLAYVNASLWPPYEQERGGAALWLDSGRHWLGSHCPGTE